MTYMFRSPVTAERRIASGQPAFINIWKMVRVGTLQAGDAHWTRENADRAIENNTFEMPPRNKCLYRVVVRPKE